MVCEIRELKMVLAPSVLCGKKKKGRFLVGLGVRVVCGF
jgi:hypothetical protein